MKITQAVRTGTNLYHKRQQTAIPLFIYNRFLLDRNKVLYIFPIQSLVVEEIHGNIRLLLMNSIPEFQWKMA